jgi:hypothetical protein
LGVDRSRSGASLIDHHKVECVDLAVLSIDTSKVTVEHFAGR